MLWYIRGSAIVAALDQVSVVGLQISFVRTSEVVRRALRAADRHHLPVGEDDQVVLVAERPGQASCAPRRRSGVEIDHGGGGGAGRLARHDHQARAVHRRRAVHDGRAGTDGPRTSVDIEEPGLARGDRVDEDPTVGHEERERVLGLVDVRGRHAGQQRPGVGGRVIDLRRVGEDAVGDLTADGDDPAVAERCDAGVPASDLHVGNPRPRHRHRVEDVGVLDADLAARVATGDEDATVGELDMTAAEDTEFTGRDVNVLVAGSRPRPRWPSGASQPSTASTLPCAAGSCGWRRSASSCAATTDRRRPARRRRTTGWRRRRRHS